MTVHPDPSPIAPLDGRSGRITTYDDDAPEDLLAAVDTGLGADNDRAAPLHEVRRLACALHDADGALQGGAVGRRWGACAELQQLWVAPSLRRQGLGAALVRAFEARARQHGCRVFYLETFSFQAPSLYQRLGYATVHSLDVYPHGIVKHLMVRADPPEPIGRA